MQCLVCMKNRLEYFTLCLILILAGQSAIAQETIRPQTLDDLAHSYPAKNYRLKNAKVAYVDYAALRGDFLFLRDLTNPQIDKWVLENFAYMDATQLELLGIRFVGRNQPHPQQLLENGGGLESYDANDFIDMKDVKKSVRPSEYNRADVMEAKDLSGKTVGLIDRKGTGVNPMVREWMPPRSHREYYQDYFEAVHAKNFEAMNNTFNKDHSDGLASGGEAVAEMTREHATRLAFQVNGSGATVKSYFIIDTGIDILKSNGKKIPAAIYARQAHWRNESNFTNDTDSVLRIGKESLKPSSYIVTDDSGYLQRTISDTMVDFGGVIVREKSVAKNFGVPEDGYMAGDHGDERRSNPQKSYPWVWGHLAYDYFLRSGDPEAISRHLTEMLGTLPTQAPKTRGEPTGFQTALSDRLLLVELFQQNHPQLMKHLLEMSETRKDPQFLNYLVPRLAKPQIEEFMKKSSPAAKSDFRFLSGSGLHPDYNSGRQLPPLTAEQYVKMALIQAKESDPKLREFALSNLNHVFARSIGQGKISQDYLSALAALLKFSKTDPQIVTTALEGIEPFLSKYNTYNYRQGADKEMIKVISLVKSRAGANLRCEAVFLP